ncbi:nitroreductase/quinone reductase family protein [Mycetocola zhadangensis]|uniref:nitroreductase/quinone reductase family protein n=1 Tax=Mycetocola zhadangensis TaxID=1164595 RepID=UPI003A4D4A13
MTSFAPTLDRHARNTAIITQLRSNAGRTDGGQVLVILRTIGLRSGQEREIPVCVREDGEDLIVVASAGGQPTHPQWYPNVVARPDITVEYLGETFRARATTERNTPERDRLFGLLSEEVTGLYEYQDRCRDHRQIPVVRLQRVSA